MPYKNKKLKYIIFGKLQAFTVIELLIVIVVIAVLAAITIVYYSSVSNKATSSAMAYELSQVSRILKSDYSINSQYPTSLESANNGNGVNLSSSYSKNYFYDNGLGLKSFCMEEVSNSVSYLITAFAGPIEGRCWQISTNKLPVANNQLDIYASNNFLYVPGGTGTDGTGVGSVRYAAIQADGSVGTWSLSPYALPVPRQRNSTVSYNGYIYVMGGNASGNPQSSVFYSKIQPDGTPGTWSSTTSLPVGERRHTSVIWNGVVYIIGGSNPARADIYSAPINADGTIGAWTLQAEHLPSGRYFHSSIINNGYMYAFGGVNDVGTVFSDVLYAQVNTDGTIGPWVTNTNSLPVPLSGSRAFVYNNKAYVVGGTKNGSNSGAVDTIYSAVINADGSTGVWQRQCSVLAKPLYYFGLSVNNSYAYIVGGVTINGSAVDSVYSMPLSNLSDCAASAS